MPTQSQATWGPRRTREVGWFDPRVTAGRALEMSGREFLEALMAGEIPRPPIAELFGTELVFVGDGEVVFRATPDEAVYNPIGLVHGGWLCTLLDSAAGCAVHTLLPVGAGYSSIEIKVSFLRPVVDGVGAMDVRGKAQRVGGRTAFAEAHAYDATGELIGHATSSLAVRRS